VTERRDSSWWRILTAVLGGLLACGVPLWPIPYREVSMPSNPSGTLWMSLAAAAGVVAAWLLRGRKPVAVFAVTGGFVLAVLARVAVETAADPTSHNLWPFEVVIAGAIGFAGAVAGVGAARVVQRLSSRKDSRPPCVGPPRRDGYVRSGVSVRLTSNRTRYKVFR
jgi:uncharacterized membrane protein YccC